ncbi:MAG: hypothetical protein M0Q87_02950 [Ottowia sp.]|nr:hypothetical protein [Ottowia sp.]
MVARLRLGVLLGAGVVLASTAQAACYTVMDTQGVVLSQTSTPPVDMSRPLHETVPVRYGRGAHMVFGVADAPCGPPADAWFGAQSTAQRTLRPAKADRG